MRLIRKLLGENRDNKMLRLIMVQTQLITGSNLRAFSLIGQRLLYRVQRENRIGHKYKKISQNRFKYCTISDSSTQQAKMQACKQMQAKPSQTKQVVVQNTNQQSKLPSNEQSPISQYDKQLFVQMAIYQKPNIQSQQYSSRCGRRKYKLQKIRIEMKDPQVRRERNKERHNKQKQKLQRNLQGLSQQQKRAYLDKRKQQRQQLKDRVREAVDKQVGQPFLVDLAYEHRMNDKQNKSLTAQIQLIVTAVKRINTPPNVHLCGLKQGKVKQQLQVMKYQYWPIKSYQASLEQCLKMQKFKGKNVYYLSPDATQTLDTIGQYDVFVIGGLVDRTVIKNASLNRAQQLGIQARSLPVKPFMKQRTCLNLDHIVTMVCRFMELRNWEEAFSLGAPKRWKKQNNQKALKLNQNQQYPQQQDSGQQQTLQNQLKEHKNV